MINNRLVKYTIYTLLIVTTLTLFTKCNKTPEETLKAIAQEAQRDCPHIMDEVTTMLSVEALPDRTLKYTYLAKQELSEDEMKMANVAMKNILLERLQSQPELEFYKESEVTFIHNFTDRNNQTVVLVKIDPIDYR